MEKEEISWGQKFVYDAIGENREGIKGIIAIHFGFIRSEKRWPGEDARRIISLVVKNGYKCFLFDYFGVVEGGCPEGVVFASNVKDNDSVMSIISACDILLCCDSTIYNIGRNLKKRVIPLFGFVPNGKGGKGCVDYVPNPEAVLDIIDNEWESMIEDGELISVSKEIKVFEI